ADGVATNEVRVTLKDANNNAVPGQSISFTMSGSAQSASPVTVTTDPNGQASLTLTNTVAENVTVTATHSSGSRDVSVTFIADSGSTDINNVNSSFVVSSDNAVADGVATNEVRVTLKDANNNAVAGESISFSLTGSAQAASGVSVTTDANGQASFTLTNTVAENVTVTATHSSGSRNVSVVFAADSGSADIDGTYSSFDVISDNAVADGVATNEVRVTLKDANNNAVPGESISFTMSGSAQTGMLATLITDANGQASFTLTNTVAENVTVTATHGSGSRDVNVTFIADSGSADINNVNSSFVVSSDNAVADGVATNEVRVALKDANNNAVAGESISFSMTGSAQAASGVSVTTDANGQASFTLTNTVAENVTVTATHSSGSRDVS
ncbi:TPA: hypothetical protein I7784_22925, partial [Vibrio vulnificus]|nr:hypothetical protein [Vibrio vulnificus]